MIEVKFYNDIEDEKLKFAVIVAKANGKLVFCRHKKRSTWEVPGGHREQGENILDTAKRELYEETGALEFSIKPVTIYSVCEENGKETFGKLFFAEITEFEDELHSEIEEITFLDDHPENMTYPLIQPKLIEKIKELTL